MNKKCLSLVVMILVFAVFVVPGFAQNWTGNGGGGMSLAILAPKATGLGENQSYLPVLVQGEFVSNFSGYSAISVMDRVSLQKVYDELLSGYYSDDDEAGLNLGHLTATDYILTGNITRTATEYVLQIQITKTADKRTTASYSGRFTFAELDNLTGIRRASLDLLKKMGVTLTAQAQRELSGAAAINHVNAQTALARGITAQRQGTKIAALSYYFEAAAYDPSLLEAVNRTSILNANITGSNIGDNLRSDQQWYDEWKARLTETEQYFDNLNRTDSIPYTLFYSGEIKQGAQNYNNRTATLSIETHLHGSDIWTVAIERTLQMIYDGLDATGRKNTWGLAGWPQRGVTNLNAFTRQSNNFNVVFELLNDRNQVIGRQTLQSGGSWELKSGRPIVTVNADVGRTLNFQNVNIDNISDNMTIQVATVNGTDAATAVRIGVLQIQALTKSEFDLNVRMANLFRFSRGTILGWGDEGNRLLRSTNRGIGIVFPATIWGDPVIAIGSRAFQNNNRLTEVTLPDSIRSIGEAAFHSDYTTPQLHLKSVTIGANVAMAFNPFRYTYKNTNDATALTDDGFRVTYDRSNKAAGTYTYSTGKAMAKNVFVFSNITEWSYSSPSGTDR